MKSSHLLAGAIVLAVLSFVALEGGVLRPVQLARLISEPEPATGGLVGLHPSEPTDTGRRAARAEDAATEFRTARGIGADLAAALVRGRVSTTGGRAARRIPADRSGARGAPGERGCAVGGCVAGGHARAGRQGPRPTSGRRRRSHAHPCRRYAARGRGARAGSVRRRGRRSGRARDSVSRSSTSPRCSTARCAIELGRRARRLTRVVSDCGCGDVARCMLGLAVTLCLLGMSFDGAAMSCSIAAPKRRRGEQRARARRAAGSVRWSAVHLCTPALQAAQQLARRPLRGARQGVHPPRPVARVLAAPDGRRLRRLGGEQVRITLRQGPPDVCHRRVNPRDANSRHNTTSRTQSLKGRAHPSPLAI